MVFASSLIGTPYGFGCKDPLNPFPITAPDGKKYCADPDDPNKGKFGIDCSGLVQFAYHLAGFPYFTGRIAAEQYEVAGQFGCYPAANRVNSSDVIFFDRTYDRVEPKGLGPEDTLTHVSDRQT